MAMTPGDHADEAGAIEEAIAAFDSANLAWGQFYLHTWARRPVADQAAAQAVREALGDAALSVPRAGEAAQIRAFSQALLTAYARLVAFLAGLAPGLAPGDVQAATAALLEAVELLRPFTETTEGQA